MDTKILKSFAGLQLELDDAKTSLKEVTQNIERLTSGARAPSKIRPRNGRVTVNQELSVSKRNKKWEDNDKHSRSVFNRLSSGSKLVSKVVKPREISTRSRENALEAQCGDKKFKVRNMRMFGVMLGTLEKFRQEEQKLKPMELKRAQVERKIEEQEIRKQNEIMKQKQELLLSRKQKLAEIKMIELKMLRLKEYANWEETQKSKSNFISTKAKPLLYYLPNRLNEDTKPLLKNSKIDVDIIIQSKKEELLVELQHIEDRINEKFEMNNEENQEYTKNDEEHEIHNMEDLRQILL